MKILIKIGSALISQNNSVNYKWLKQKVKEIAKLHKKGHDIVIVSSGAVAAGMETEKLEKRPKDTLKLQLLSGEGQIKLMKYYQDLFNKYRIGITQVLLTHHNFDKIIEEKTIVRILNAYLRQKTIPIINENDLISKEEFEANKIFTDNDILAALVANGLKVDLAILLTDVDGLCKIDPKINKCAELVEEVTEIDEKIKRMASKESNSLGLGGMYSKVKAAELMIKQGVDVIVANGNKKIEDILNNKVKRTLFKKK